MGSSVSSVTQCEVSQFSQITFNKWFATSAVGLRFSRKGARRHAGDVGHADVVGPVVNGSLRNAEITSERRRYEL